MNEKAVTTMATKRRKKNAASRGAPLKVHTSPHVTGNLIQALRYQNHPRDPYGKSDRGGEKKKKDQFHVPQSQRSKLLKIFKCFVMFTDV